MIIIVANTVHATIPPKLLPQGNLGLQIRIGFEFSSSYILMGYTHLHSLLIYVSYTCQLSHIMRKSQACGSKISVQCIKDNSCAWLTNPDNLFFNSLRVICYGVQ